MGTLRFVMSGVRVGCDEMLESIMAESGDSGDVVFW
jgi:hypothetical protein